MDSQQEVRWMSWVDDKIREFDALTRSLNNLVARVDSGLEGVDAQFVAMVERLVRLERFVELLADAKLLERLELLEELEEQRADQAEQLDAVVG